MNEVLVAIPNVSSPCPVGWCAYYPLPDLPTFVKCAPPGYACPGALTPSPVPTLSSWAYLALAVLVAAAALSLLTRSKP